MPEVSSRSTAAIRVNQPRASPAPSSPASAAASMLASCCPPAFSRPHTPRLAWLPPPLSARFQSIAPSPSHLDRVRTGPRVP